LTFLYRVGAGSLFCLMPLALYFLFLATLNHRRRPTLLSGRWDFTGLLLGLSGFILMGGPLLVSTIDSTWRSVLFGGNFDRLRSAWDANSRIWSLTVLAYLLALAGTIYYMLHRRQQVSVIYNIDPAEVGGIIESAASGQGLRARSIVGGWEILKPAKNFEADNELLLTRREYSEATIAVESFVAFRNVSLRWQARDPQLLCALEQEIARRLQEVESPENPTAGWLMTAAVSLFGVMFFWMAYLIYMLLLR